MLDAIIELADRPANELTRRDVARYLLTLSSEDALAGIPKLRRDLMAAGNPLSTAFWESSEATLESIKGGRATFGSVDAWLEATGTEPSHLLPTELFVWPDPGERGPVANEMHAALVAHLEELCAAGEIDPDLLLSGDKDALADYRRRQVEWLRSPLSDGRIPEVAVSDEADDALLAEWDAAETEARWILGRFLDDVGDRPRPEADLHAVCARLRAELGSRDATYRLLLRSSGLKATSLPDDDTDLWLALAASVVEPRELAPRGVISTEEEAAWNTLQHADWIAAAVLLARGGPGTNIDEYEFARDVLEFDLEAADDIGSDTDNDTDGDTDSDLDDFYDDALVGDVDDDASVLAIGFSTVVRLWRVLGIVDADDRLTDLGWWGVPESVLHAWRDVPSS